MSKHPAPADDILVPNKVRLVTVIVPKAAADAELEERVAELEEELGRYAQRIASLGGQISDLESDSVKWMNTENEIVVELHEDKTRLYQENQKMGIDVQLLQDKLDKCCLGHVQLKDACIQTDNDSVEAQRTTQGAQTKPDVPEDKLEALRAELRMWQEKFEQEVLKHTVTALSNMRLQDKDACPSPKPVSKGPRVQYTVQDEGKERVFCLKFRYYGELPIHDLSDESEPSSPCGSLLPSPDVPGSPLPPPPPPPPPSALPSTPLPAAGDWIEAAKGYLDIGASERFAQLVQKWATAERKQLPTRLGLSKLPQSIENWRKKKGVERYTESIEPVIDKAFALAFPTQVWNWWYKIQPAARGDPVQKRLPAFTGKWTNLDRWGPNGWVMLLVALKWWRISIDQLESDQREAGSGDWALAVEDMSTTFEAMIAVV